MTPTPCSRCGEPGRWRDERGRHWCVSHLPAGERLRCVAKADILERLATRPAIGASVDDLELFRDAAAEIRRLREEVSRG